MPFGAFVSVWKSTSWHKRWGLAVRELSENHRVARRFWENTSVKKLANQLISPVSLEGVYTMS